MTGMVMQVYKLLGDDVGNKHEQHNAKHERDKSSFANHLVNLRNISMAFDSKPQSYTVLSCENTGAPVMPEITSKDSDME